MGLSNRLDDAAKGNGFGEALYRSAKGIKDKAKILLGYLYGMDFMLDHATAGLRIERLPGICFDSYHRHGTEQSSIGWVGKKKNLKRYQNMIWLDS